MNAVLDKSSVCNLVKCEANLRSANRNVLIMMVGCCNRVSFVFGQLYTKIKADNGDESLELGAKE